MSDFTVVPLSQLKVDTAYDSISDLSQSAMQVVEELNREAIGIKEDSASFSSALDGPARNGSLTSDLSLRSFSHSMEMAMRMNQNLTSFTALSSTLTTFGNNLNSFLKGQ